MFDTLNWDDLRVFLHAARAGNLSQTAKRMRLDHSTVSRRISQMEASLGVAVFERHRTGLKLNEIGERLLRHAEKVESAIIAIHEEASTGDTEGLAGTVRLATMEGIASLYLAQRFSKLRQAAPQPQAVSAHASAFARSRVVRAANASAKTDSMVAVESMALTLRPRVKLPIVEPIANPK